LTDEVQDIGGPPFCAYVTNSAAYGAENMHRLKLLTLAVFLPNLIAFFGCEGLLPHDTQSLLVPSLQRSEIVGVVAGFGTTFAAMPDLIAMLRRRSSAGMNPRMAAIMGVFQVLWVYYGLLILSRPVVLWNIIAVLVNSLSVSAYLFFARGEKRRQVKM
jgi:MtN3 and saliva related transmembrane protein